MIIKTCWIEKKSSEFWKNSEVPGNSVLVMEIQIKISNKIFRDLSCSPQKLTESSVSKTIQMKFFFLKLKNLCSRQWYCGMNGMDDGVKN